MIKSIALGADEDLIRRAREQAARGSKSLNKVFREWLVMYAGPGEEAVANGRRLMKRLRHVELHGPFTREEMNERR